jgi:hypothetical protein
LAGIMAAVFVQQPIVLKPLENIITRYGSGPLFYAFAFVFTSELAQLFDNVRSARKALWEILRQTLEPDEIIALALLGFIGATVLCVGFLALKSLAKMSTDDADQEIPPGLQTAPGPARPLETDELNEAMVPLSITRWRRATNASQAQTQDSRKEARGRDFGAPLAEPQKPA